MKHIFLLLIFIASLWAEPVVSIDSGPIKIENFQVEYFVDQSGSLSISEMQDQTFQKGTNAFSMGVNADVTWIRFSLQNESSKTRVLSIHNIYTYLSYDTHFFELLNGAVIGDAQYSPAKNFHTDQMFGAESIYTVELEAKQRKTIYLRSHFKAYQLGRIEIFDSRNSKENLTKAFVPAIVIAIILLTLALYHLVLFFYSRRIEYIYYSLYLITAAIFTSYTYGAFSHYFSVYGDLALRLNAVTMLPPIFLSLFVKTIFYTAKKYISFNRILNSFILLFFLLYLYSLYRYYQAIELASVLYIYFFVGMLWIILSLFKKGVPFSGYFLTAHSFYLLFAIVAILLYNGLLPLNSLTFYALGSGTLVEAFILGFLISYRIRLLEERYKIYNMQLVVDKMTSLYNKSYFEEIFGEEITYAQEEGEGFALMILDIDFFKQYNDTYGHLEGDKALIAVSSVLRRNLRRQTDMAFRIGGEEFAVLTEMQVKEAYAMAQKILQDIRDLKIAHHGSSIADHLTISIGIYIVTGEPHETADNVYHLADQALYDAKAQGRDQVVLAHKDS